MWDLSILCRHFIYVKNVLEVAVFTWQYFWYLSFFDIDPTVALMWSFNEIKILKLFVYFFFNRIYFYKYQNDLKVLCKDGVPRNFANFIGKHLYQSLSFSKFAKKETLARVFPCEIWEISKNIFSYRTASMTASNCINS